jgi:hypothetical protein
VVAPQLAGRLTLTRDTRFENWTILSESISVISIYQQFACLVEIRTEL